jgi:hypothetical protein
MAPPLWSFVDRIVDDHFHGKRSGYFQRLVTADMAETSSGVPYSRIVGDPSALPKAVQNVVFERLDRIERVLETLVDQKNEQITHKRR